MPFIKILYRRKGKVKGDKRLKVPDSVSSVKDSIINKCRSSRSITRKTEQQNGKIKANGSAKRKGSKDEELESLFQKLVKTDSSDKYSTMSLDDNNVQEMARQIKLEVIIAF